MQAVRDVRLARVQFESKSMVVLSINSVDFLYVFGIEEPSSKISQLHLQYIRTALGQVIIAIAIIGLSHACTGFSFSGRKASATNCIENLIVHPRQPVRHFLRRVVGRIKHHLKIDRSVGGICFRIRASMSSIHDSVLLSISID